MEHPVLSSRGRQNALETIGDFHEWLLEASDKAKECHSLEEFFSRLRSGV
jgi:hypothetical protein